VNIKPLIATNGLSVAGNGCMAVQPIVVGALVDRLQFTESQAGLVAAVEMAGVGVGLLLLFTFAHRVPARVLAGVGLAMIVLANLAACLVHTFDLMLLVQLLVGFGSATVFSVYLAVGASQERPEHLFAIVNAVSIAYSGLFLPVAPGILTAWQLPGIFLTLAAIAAAAAFLIPWLPAVCAPRASLAVEREPMSAKFHGRVVSILCMMLLLYTGHGAVWAYQERIGVALGMGPQRVGQWLGASMLFWGVAGSVLASWLDLRIGRLWPQILSLGASVIAALLLVSAATPALFALACGLIAFSWFYGLPYQMGLLAQYDPRGRLNIVGCAMSTGGAALGPALAATLVGSTGHWAIGVLAGLCYLIGLLLVLPPSLEQSRAASLSLDA
jgi:predicted MFS family arabinose efflux permease